MASNNLSQLDCLSTESFPTSVRTTAMGLLSAAGRLGSIAGQLTFSVLIHVSVAVLLVTAGAMLLLGAAAGFLLPQETANVKLASDVPGDAAPWNELFSVDDSPLALDQQSTAASIVVAEIDDNFVPPQLQYEGVDR